MTTLTSSSTFTIGDGSAVVETADVPILPALGSSTGKGRLVHPTLGTLDYENAPDEWVNIDSDLIIAPIWASQKTLVGAANALWAGNLRDVLVEEHWTQAINVKIGFLRQLLAFWQNPPDPDTGTPVTWWPNYVSTLGFEVAMLAVKVGDTDVTLNPTALLRGWVSDKIVLSMRILGRAS